MSSRRFFRYLWRTNAVLIFLSTAGIVLLTMVLTLSELGCNLQRRRAVEAAPPVAADAQEKLYLGPVRAVEGGHVLRGELLVQRQGLGIGSGYESSETRNILYLDIGSTEARWLLPDSSRLISEEETVWSDEGDTRARQQVAVLALVKPSTADPELAEGELLVYDPSGKRITTVAEGVRTLNHASLLENDNILVLFERGRRYVRAMINAQSFEVTSVQDVSVPELR